MARNDDNWLPGRTDRDWIESVSKPLDPALLAMEAAARPEGIPILDRESGRVLATLAASRRRIVEVGTAIGYSTLWMALAMPGDATIVTIDPDRGRTDRARAFWRSAGVADAKIQVVTAPALDAFARGEPALDGPFDLVFIDALKHEYPAYLEALRSRLAPGATVAADNVLWSGRTSGSEPPMDDPNAVVLRAFCAQVSADPAFETAILPIGDGLLVATLRS